ncbi:MAG TPA: OmpA family protein [Falsiroseomonas sp.]|jgi:opacity protein-like surface antigen|nr:OmpA family protein [Falsiroseomonas sp.]
MNFRTSLLATTLLVVPGLAAAQPVSGLYIAGGAGVNWLMDTDLDSTGQLATALTAAGRPTTGEIGFDLGWVGVISLGYGFGNGVRAEIEGSYRQNDVDEITGFGGTTGASGEARSYGVMANAFYDFDLGAAAEFAGVRFMPYVGVGVGYIWREFDDVRAGVLGGTVRTDGSDGRFAYQAIVGAATSLNQYVPGLALTAEYRFLGTLEQDIDTSSGGGSFTVSRGGTESENFNHSILIGLRYALNPPAPPPPVAAPVAPAVAPAPARTYLVFFDFDRADLTDRARQIIADAAQASTRVQTTRIEVAGHADRAGNPQYNQRLSMRRAQAVGQELVRLGVPQGAIDLQAFGESRPLVPTADGVREPQNRRVEIVLR